MKGSLHKYLSVLYLLLFIFQISIVYTSVGKNFSVIALKSICHENLSQDKNNLMDIEHNDVENEGNEDNQENEEQEVDLEDDFVKDPNQLCLSDFSLKTHFKYVLRLTNPKVKVHFAPPEVVV